MGAVSDTVFLFDVDNTLLDNDRVEQDLRHHLESEFGKEGNIRYFSILKKLQNKLGYVDYLGAFQRFRIERRCDQRLLSLSSFLVDYPFADRLFPAALDVLKRVQQWGPTVILSDGDAVLQPRKIQKAGLWSAVEGRVLIYIHKEGMLEDVERAYPARHYVMADDKPRILAAMKNSWSGRLTTIFPRQGHYALKPENTAAYPQADITIEKIGDLMHYELSALSGDMRKD